MNSPDRADELDAVLRPDVCIVGAGPAGLMAAIAAARAGASTVLLEANPQTGRKLLITGGGRCNFTHVGDANGMVRTFGKAGRFLRHAFHELPPQEIVSYFRSRGIESAVEPDGSIFPASLGAVDIREVLLREASSLGARLMTDSKVLQVAPDDGGFSVRTGRRTILARRLIIAAGGVSYPQTGSTGDGYRFAQTLGHTVTPPRASCVPVRTAETWPGTMAGVSIDPVVIKTSIEGRKIAVRGAMLFTHDGISGPAGLDLSWHIADRFSPRSTVAIRIDLIPETDAEKLDQSLQQKFAQGPRKELVNVLSELFPKRLAAILCDLAGCAGDTQAAQLKKEGRRRIVSIAKALPLGVTGTRPIAEATVTRGGVSTDEIDPRTMQSRIRPGLFFAGEVIDVDGPCGGYNLQMCWSTGALAGRSAAQAS
jgi:predicted Rossmann fold flavoprotein